MTIDDATFLQKADTQIAATSPAAFAAPGCSGHLSTSACLRCAKPIPRLLT